MEPRVVERGEIVLVGFGFYGDPFQSSAGWTEENEIGRLWQRLMAFLDENRGRLRHIQNENVAYEVHVEHKETAEKGFFEVFTGVEVEQLEAIPVELVVKILPPSKYAVFTLQGEQIGSDWGRMIYQDWLPGSGYKLAHKFSFQCYDERFKGVDNLAESVLELYMPVEKCHT